ncbi:MAG: hypothetical protein O3A63_16175 [Proteobacteria bacterium]|nr:hypothetical protein [Pseudomonadota bacterium]
MDFGNRHLDIATGTKLVSELDVFSILFDEPGGFGPQLTFGTDLVRYAGVLIDRCVTQNVHGLSQGISAQAAQQDENAEV